MDTYRHLKAWQLCQILVLEVYRVTKSLPESERFGLTDQLRRAAVSACANLAEGYARRGAGELGRFAGISVGSLAEVDALLEIARRLGYVTDEAHSELRAHYVAASKTTFALMRACVLRRSQPKRARG